MHWLWMLILNGHLLIQPMVFPTFSGLRTGQLQVDNNFTCPAQSGICNVQQWKSEISQIDGVEISFKFRFK